MKRVNFFCVLVCFLLGHAEMHAQICEQIDIATSDGLTSVFFVDAQNGWLVGVNGTIFKTTDAGTHWATQSSGTNLQLNDVYFSNHQEGIVVGNDGLILITDDAGETWSPTESNIKDCLFAVDSYDNQSFWVVGASGAVLQSEDRGEQWQKVPIAEATGNLYNLTSTLSGEMIAVGEANQLISLNNSRSAIPSLASGNAGATNTSVVVNEGKLFISSSEGVARRPMSNADKSAAENLQSGFVRKLTIHQKTGRSILVGYRGQLKSLEENGEWLTVDCSTTMGLNDVTFSEAQRAWAVGNQGTLLRIDFAAIESLNSFIANISPNPSSGIFELTTTAEQYAVTIFDDKGSVVREIPASSLSSQLIDLSDRTSGMYLVQVQSRDYQQAMKVVLINE